MILTVSELRNYIQSDWDDIILEDKLLAIESLIRAYTNNNFQNRKIRCESAIVDGVITAPSIYFRSGDTVQISNSELNDGLFVLQNDFSLSPLPYDCSENLITKVEYPNDVKMGAINLLKWDLDNRDKVGIASETISRHSVTYFNMDGDNSITGFPKSFMGFLEPYKKARF